MTDTNPDRVHYKQYSAPSGGEGGSGEFAEAVLPSAEQTSILTIWRTLWAELDSMAGPDATDPAPIERGEFVDEPGATEDDVSFDPAAPDISLAVQELARACITLQQLPDGLDLRDDLAFRHNLDINAQGRYDFSDVRNVGPDGFFWNVHIVGCYESGEAWDYDWEQYWHVGQSFGPVAIFQESHSRPRGFNRR